MPAIVLYFHVHQPLRIKPLTVFEIGSHPDYHGLKDSTYPLNREIIQKVAHKCYLPANRLLLKLLKTNPGFKVSFSITGIVIEQLLHYQPEVILQFKQMASTGRVEFLNETYYHSLASLHSETEFFKQVTLHRQMIHELFDQDSKSFRNTELIYNDHIAKLIENMGYQVILAEGVDRYLDWRSPNFVYTAFQAPKLKLLLKNYRLSDDIAFRFGNRDWSGWPLTALKFSRWLSALNGNAHLVNLFMDYETIGEHQWADTGIFNFFENLPRELAKHPDNHFMTVSEAAESFPSQDTISMPITTSWADLERDVTAWLGNPLQQAAADFLYGLEKAVYEVNDPGLIRSWQQLTTSDHFYYMCTKWFSDGDVHKYFSPEKTPYDAFVHYLNTLQDFTQRLYAKQSAGIKSTGFPNYHLLSGVSAHDYRYS